MRLLMMAADLEQCAATSFAADEDSSFHLTVNAPLGSYDRNSSVNTGGNRWAFTPVVNLGITPDKGISWIDLYVGGRFVTDNNAFRGNNVLLQNPLGVLRAHYSHNIRKGMWAGIGVSVPVVSPLTFSCRKRHPPEQIEASVAKSLGWPYLGVA